MDVSGQLHGPATLPPEKEPLAPTGYEAGYQAGKSRLGAEM